MVCDINFLPVTDAADRKRESREGNFCSNGTNGNLGPINTANNDECAPEAQWSKHWPQQPAVESFSVIGFWNARVWEDL